MDDTLYQIQKLERERHNLYLKLGRGEGNAEDRIRVAQMADQLGVLWDRHRREDAARRWGARSVTRQKTDAA